MLPNLAIFFVSLILLSTCSPSTKATKAVGPGINEKVILRPEFKKYFDQCQVEGSIVLFDDAQKRWVASDTVGIYTEMLPASTFKIINLLIALETKTIADENEVIKWVGKTDTLKYGYRPEIYHDMTVREAFRISAGWAFIELSKKIGKDRYMKYLKQCNYGNLDLSRDDSDFWNYGSFGISPVNQVEFLRLLHQEKLPFSVKHMRTVKEVMKTEENAGYSIHSKTGWTREGGTSIGWWVGYLETGKGATFFATRILTRAKSAGPDLGPCRKEITRSVLRELKVLE